VRRELLLCVKHSLLRSAKWDGLGSGDFVILELIDEAERQSLPFLGIQESHPAVEFEGRRSCRVVIGSDEALGYFREVDSIHFPSTLAPVAGQRVTCDRKHPRPEQSPVADLTGLAVHGQHDLLREIFGNRFTAARSEESHKLRRQNLEQRREGLFVGSVQERLHRRLWKAVLVCNSLIDHLRIEPLA